MPEPVGEPELFHEKEQLVNNKVKAEKRKRSPTAEDISHTEGTSVKKKRTVERGELNEEPFPMNVKTEIRNGKYFHFSLNFIQLFFSLDNQGYIFYRAEFSS
ncbi:unnamed protein product [Haemonchus placei]|uniref:Protein MNN4-like n=1 Tax=Haemonchus placei TaxID=6290 RepID=A0A0N4X2N7_HAEPC|nr:unnamed protein product [Haemonchus placei]